MVWRSLSVDVQSIDTRKRHLRGASNSIEFSLELTHKTEVNQSMKYIHSNKFKALGIAVATAVAVAATATPGSATNYQVTDTTGAITDTTGPQATDTSGKTDDNFGGKGDHKGKHGKNVVLNAQQNAAIKALIVKVNQDFKAAKDAGKLDTFYRVTLPAAKAQYLAIIKATDITGSGHASSLTGAKDESKGRINSLLGIKDEHKGRMDRSHW
jgi:hypothetical protein